jgi:hypothetical protein
MESIYAMAQCGRDLVNNCSVYVNPDLNRIGNEYFKFCNSSIWTKADKICRISFNKPQYVIHRGPKQNWKLSSGEKKILINLLNSKSRKYDCTVWQYLILAFNDERFGLDFDMTQNVTVSYQYELASKYQLTAEERILFHCLPYDLPMPNYMMLK